MTRRRGETLFVVAQDAGRRFVRRRSPLRLMLGTRTAEVRAQELAGAGQCGVAFVEHRGEPLEHVRNAGCDLEGDGDVGRGGAGGEPCGVVEQDLV